MLDWSEAGELFADERPLGRQAAVLSLLHPAEMACELLKLPLGRHRVAERLAAYRVVALPVIDSAGRLVGAVTIDDVLDRLLPRGWRLSQEAG